MKEAASNTWLAAAALVESFADRLAAESRALVDGAAVRASAAAVRAAATILRGRAAAESRDETPMMDDDPTMPDAVFES